MGGLPQAGDFPFFPSFFLIGAPRCGTTSISRYLAGHPQICFSRPKELHYFNRVSTESLVRIGQDYLGRYFAHYDPERHLVLGEGSVSYLYAPAALERILQIQPAAHFIVAVRNPIDMLRSYHFRLLYLLEEDQEDFRLAWDLQQARARGERLPNLCNDPRRLLYGEVASLGTQLERLREIAGPERCHVVVNDDLRTRPGEVYRDLLRFVGLEGALDAVAETDEPGRYPHRLRSKTYRWRWLQILLCKPPSFVFPASAQREVLRGVPPPALKRLRNRLLKLNRVERGPAPFSPELRAMLRDYFEEDIRKLGEILGRDLGGWR